MSVRVVYGARHQDVDFVGRTVGEALQYLRQTLNLPDNPTTLITGRSVGNDYVLQEGEQLECVRETGQKA